MASVVVLAGLVNSIELFCTAGFPAVYTQILTMQQLPTWQYYAGRWLKLTSGLVMEGLGLVLLLAPEWLI